MDWFCFERIDRMRILWVGQHVRLMWRGFACTFNRHHWYLDIRGLLSGLEYVEWRYRGGLVMGPVSIDVWRQRVLHEQEAVRLACLSVPDNC